MAEPAPSAGFAVASFDDRCELRRLQLAGQRFVVDVDGPYPTRTAADFAGACGPGHRLHVLRIDGRLEAALLLRDVDRQLGIATVDILAPARSDLRAVVHREVERLHALAGVARLQAFAFADDALRLANAAALGFRREGVLRSQCAIGRQRHDLVVLARGSTGAAAPSPAANGLPPRPLRRTRTAGPTLVVRRIRSSDRAVLKGWLGVGANQALLDDRPLSRAAVDAKVDELLPGGFGNSRGFLLLVGRVPVGLVHFMNWSRRSRTAEVDLLVAEPHRGSLLTGAALMTLPVLAFEELGLSKIYAFVYAGNARSVRVLRRCMQLEAQLVGYRPVAGGREDALVFGLLAGEFAAVIAATGPDARRPRAGRRNGA